MSLIKGLVSVIIPCFNNASFLRRCIDSVLAQTYSNIEIIVIDDGSTDNPSSALADVTDIRLHRIISMPHQGVSSARNVGIHNALGQYIVFIDGDDWIEPNHIELLVSGLQYADCSMIMMSVDYPDRTEINDSCLSLAKEKHFIKEHEFNLLFENYLLSSPCNKIYQTRLIREVNFLQFDRSITYAEDLLFNLEYFRMIKTVTLNSEATYHYVKHGESGTSRFHINTAYTLCRLSTAVSNLLGANLNQDSLAILMRHYLWGLSNLHHPNSPLNDRQIRAEIGLIVTIPEYRHAKSTIHSLGISPRLQLLLKTDAPTLIHWAFKYSRR